MKNTLLFIFLIFVLEAATAQNSHLVNEWMTNATSKQPLLISAIAISPADNLYIAGGFEKTMKIKNRTVESKAEGKDFIARFNKQDTLEQISTVKAQAYLHISSLFADKNERLLAAGYFSDTLQFSNITLIAKSYIDVFLADIDESGVLLNTKQIVGNFNGSQLFYITDGQGFRYFAASFSGKSISIGQKTLTTNGNNSIVILKFNEENKLVNSLVIPGKGNITLNDMKIHRTNLFLSGSFSKSFVAGTKTYRSKGGEDAFFITLNQNLKPDEVKTFGGSYNDSGNATAFDKAGGVVYGGIFSGNIIINQKTVLDASGNNDVFILKYDIGNHLIWSNTLGGDADKYLKSLSVNNRGNIYLAGSFRGNISRNRSVAISKKNMDNVFIAKYSADGKFKYVEPLGDSASSVTCRLLTDDKGNLLIAGNYFKRFRAIDKNADSTEDLSFYVARLHDCDNSPRVNLPPDTALCANHFTIVADSGFSSYIWNDYLNGSNKLKAEKTGNYSVEAIDKYGCKSEDSIYVTLNEPKTINLGNDVTLTKGETVVLDAGDGFEKYVWSNALTAQKITVNTTNLMPGNYNYSVTGTDINNCKAEDNITIKVMDKIDATVFPNPASDLLTVQFLKNIEMEKTTVRITTELGTVVLTKNLKTSDFPVCKVNISSLARGTYYLIITQSTFNSIWKFVKL